MQRAVTAIPIVLILALLALMPPALHAQSSQPAEVNVKNFPETQEIRGDVHVTNFPATQQIRGSVFVEGMARSFTKEAIIVHPSRRADLNEMVYAGTVETEGFTSLLITLQGEMRSDVFSSGTIGVLLVPDEKPILRILRDAKRVQYPVECTAPAKSGQPIYFESDQVQQRIAFPRYRMYLYNTTNKQAEANVYFYLSNAPMVIVEGAPAR